MARRDPSGYERRPDDDYPTPNWVTDALVRSVALTGPIWEPTAGAGNIVHRLQEHGHDVTGSDIRTDHFTELDFLKVTRLIHPEIRTIVANPPYARLWPRFIEKALELVKPVDGQVVMLLKSEADHGKTRQNLFGDCAAFQSQTKLTERIVWFRRYDGKKEAPQEWHSWFAWDWKNRERPYTMYAGHDE